MNIDRPLLVLYGTVTGNAEICANKTAAHLEAQGFSARVKDIFDLPVQELRNEQVLLLCVSTYGDGDPPDSAASLWEALVQQGGLDLSALHFSVLGLGDSSYPRFCQCGKDFDAALEKLGAERLACRVDCDVDYEKPWSDGINEVVRALKYQANITSNRLHAAI